MYEENDHDLVLKGIAAWHGWEAWRATGDRRLAWWTGIKTYLYLCAQYGLLAVALITGLFATGQPLFLPVCIIAIVADVYVWLAMRRMQKRPYQMAHERSLTPPPIPGGSLPPAPPSRSVSPPTYRYGYDLTTGKFTRELTQGQ